MLMVLIIHTYIANELHEHFSTTFYLSRNDNDFMIS